MFNAQGKFQFGRSGPLGQTNGFGQYWEPDIYPDYDFLNVKPTAAEIQQFLQDRATKVNTYTFNYQFREYAGACNGNINQGGSAYPFVIFQNDLVLGENDTHWPHFAVVRFPQILETPTPPVDGYRIVVFLHGDSSDPLSVLNPMSFVNSISNNQFYRQNCIIIFPLFFGYELIPPFFTGQNCISYLLQHGNIPPFTDTTFDTLFETQEEEDQFISDRKYSGLTDNEIQLRAVLESLEALRQIEIDYDIPISRKVALIGQSMGANMAYDLAQMISRQTGEHAHELKATICFYGSTDQYAQFNIRRSKRLLASQILGYYYDQQTHEYERRIGFWYGDISKNQRLRTISQKVQSYLNTTNPALKQELREELRYNALEDSIATTWDYANGPYPLQVHHGTADTTINVENSQWLEKQMRDEDIPLEQAHFEYFETPHAGHKLEDLNSMDQVGPLLEQYLGS